MAVPIVIIDAIALKISITIISVPPLYTHHIAMDVKLGVFAILKEGLTATV